MFFFLISDCIMPTVPPVNTSFGSRPTNALYWSQASTWILLDPTLTGVPKDYDDVTIPATFYVVLDIENVIVTNLKIDGVLEIANNVSHVIQAEIIFINGGQLIIGWENDPMLNNVTILLNGEKSSANYILPNGLSSIGGKAIGVYGGLDVHGKPRNVTWTTLKTTASKGTRIITLNQPVDWVAGEEILLATTSFKAEQTEILTITSVSADATTLTLNSTLKFDHIVTQETYSTGASYRIAGAVGLLTRNVKIIGAKYATQDSDLYGNLIMN